MPDLTPSAVQDAFNPPGAFPYLNVWGTSTGGARYRVEGVNMTVFYSFTAIGPSNLRRFTITRVSMTIRRRNHTFQLGTLVYDLPGYVVAVYGESPFLGVPHAYAYQFGGNFWYVPRFGAVDWDTDEGVDLGTVGAQLIVDTSGAIQRNNNNVKSFLFGGTMTRFVVQTLLANSHIENFSDREAIDFLVGRLARGTMSGSFQQDVPWTRAPVDPPPIDPVPEPDPPDGGIVPPEPDVPGDTVEPVLLDDPYRGGSPNWPSADVGTPANQLVTIPTQEFHKVVRRG